MSYIAKPSAHHPALPKNALGKIAKPVLRTRLR